MQFLTTKIDEPSEEINDLKLSNDELFERVFIIENLVKLVD